MSRLAIAASVVFALSARAFAFDWSQCWKNYGGGIQKGDMLLRLDLGLGSSFFYPFTNGRDGRWTMPDVTATLDFAQKVGVLPFTFGGYVGVGGYGYDDDFWERRTCDECGDVKNTRVEKSSTHTRLWVGGTATYHVMLPPEKLDVYARVRFGCDMDIYNRKRECRHPDANGDHKYSDDEKGVEGHFSFGATLGATYYFTNRFGLDSELGFNIWSGKAGADFKIGATFKI